MGRESNSQNLRSERSTYAYSVTHAYRVLGGSRTLTVSHQALNLARLLFRHEHVRVEGSAPSWSASKSDVPAQETRVRDEGFAPPRPKPTGFRPATSAVPSVAHRHAAPRLALLG